MRVVCTVISVLWLAVVTGRADENRPNRCCPSLFKVKGNIKEFHFRCEVANISAGCDKLTMTESQPETRMDTFGDSYLMSDPKWHGFQENEVCTFHLPRKPGHRWQLWLMKHFAIDPIECGNPCRCGCEDHVHFEQVSSRFSQMQTFCDFVPGGGERLDGWCGHSYGPDNVQGVQPFRADANTGVMTVFRGDNINGMGQGALVLATAVPQSTKRSTLHKVQRPTMWPRSLRRTAYCHSEFSRCQNQTCNIPCECYYDMEQRTSCTLHAIFTDTSGRTARRNTISHCEVLRTGARHAVRNLRRFGRLVPTYAQLLRLE